MGEAERINAAALRVSELHEAVGGALATAGLGRLWVSGVVNGLRRGRRYTSWELVEYQPDATTVRAMLSVGAFTADMENLDATLADVGAQFCDGIEVALWGRLDPNPSYGRLRLLAEGIDPRATVGAAVLARDHLVAELEATGELVAQRRLVLADVVQRVGLISSPTAAGRSDVFAVLNRSSLPIEVVEVEAPMGGPAAPEGVARALDRLACHGVEVVVIARGGGARSDLAAWDSPVMARAIARSPVPVLCAVGHAGDRTVADLVAYQSHPTPSAAAAALVARAETHRRDTQAATIADRHSEELARERHRSRTAMLVAVLAVLAAVLAIALIL